MINILNYKQVYKVPFQLKAICENVDPLIIFFNAMKLHSITKRIIRISCFSYFNYSWAYEGKGKGTRLRYKDKGNKPPILFFCCFSILPENIRKPFRVCRKRPAT